MKKLFIKIALVVSIISFSLSSFAENNNHEKFIQKPFMEAVKRGDIEYAIAKLDYHAMVNQADEEGINALMYAALNADWEMVKVIINRYGDIYARDDDGNTVLHYLAKGAHSLREYLRTVRYINQKAEKDGRLPELYHTKNYDGKRPSEYSLLTQVQKDLDSR